MMAAIALRERPAPYDDRTNNEQRTTKLLTEAQISHLWAGQRFPAAALATRDGAAVRVLHPGRRGRGAGPDFRDAIIAAPSGPVARGDVELHVRASDFRAHGHDRDPAYARVVLHVVFEDDVREDTLLANGWRAPVVALAPWLRRRAEELAGWLASPRLWREPCCDAAARLGGEKVLETLEALGDARFSERTAALAALVDRHGHAEALYRTLLAGVAFGGDRGLLEGVADRLPWPDLAARIDDAAADRRVSIAEAALLAAAGLAGCAAASRGRPANRPERRLAGLARLIVRHRLLFASAEVLDIAASPHQLIASWSAPPFIGRSRAIELLINAVLPWAAACAVGRGDAQGQDAARACFARLPRPARYGAVAFLEENLREGAIRPALDARRQQGLLALYKTECTQGGCGRCVLS